MSVVVQKSAGLLSALISGNEFYQNVYEGNLFCNNSGSTNVGLRQLNGFTRYIPWTPTSGGDFLGVVLAMYCPIHTDAIAGDLKVELQEDSGGWVTRATSQQPLSTWWPNNLYTRFNGLIDVRFGAPYTITAVPSTWRLAISLVNYSGPIFYLLYSQNGPTEANLFFIPYIDTQVAWTASDTVVLTDRIEIDQDWTLPAVDVTSGTQSGLGNWNRHMSIWGCTKNLTTSTNPQLYIPSSLGADRTVECAGSVYFSSRSDGLLIGDSEVSPIPAARKVIWTFTGMSATKTPGFITYSSNASFVGRGVYLKAFGTRQATEVAERTNEIAIGTDQLKISGDVTSDWANGDRLTLVGAQGSAAAPSYDYREVETRTILGMSFAAGETTITLSSNVTSFYPLQTDVPNHIINCERNVVIGGDSAAVSAQRSWWRMYGAAIEFVGIETKYLYQLVVGHTLLVNYPAAEHAGLANVCKGCLATECYYALYMHSSGGGATIEDSYTVSDSNPGATMNPYGFWFDTCRYEPVTVSGCIFAGKHNMYALYTGACRRLRATDSYICGAKAIQIATGCVNCEYDNNYIHKSRYAYSLSGTLVNIYTHDNVVRDLHASTTFKSGDVFLMSSNQVIVDWYSERDDAEGFKSYFVDASNGYFRVIFDRCLAADYSGSLMASTLRDTWITGSYVGFNDHNDVTGQVLKWEPDGYVETTGTGLTDTESRTSGAGLIAWRQQRLYTDTPHIMIWHAPVDAGGVNEPVTVSAWVKLASLNYAAGTYVAPTLRMTGLGVTDGTLSAEAAVDTTDWQLIVVTGTPLRRGNLVLTFEIETDASEADSRVYWDDVIVSYAEPPLFGGLDVASDAMFIDPPINLFSTSAQVWSELLIANQVFGSFGEWIQSLLPAATRDEILADSTPFDGADIPAIKAKTDNLPADPADESSQLAQHSATQADIAALNDIDSAGVQSAMTAQGYTTARALKLDSLDAAVSSRSSHDAAAVDTQLSSAHGSGSWEGDTAANVADAVWDEAKADHASAGSFGEALNDLGLRINAAISESGTDLLATVWWSRNDRVITGLFSSVSAVVKDSAGSQVLDLGAATEIGGRFAWTGLIASITVGEGFSLEVTADTLVYAVAFARN